MARWLVATAIALCGLAWRKCELTDTDRIIYNHRPGLCRVIPGIEKGSEDIEMVRSEGIAFITSGVVFMQQQRTNVTGKIFLYDFNQKEQLQVTELPINGASFKQAAFHPHGLSHWIVNGVIRLYVISHTMDYKHSVEVFDYDPSGPSLLHKKSIKNPNFFRPNDLVAVGPDQFLLNNDGVAQTERTNMIENLFSYRGGSVVLWDGNDSYTVLSGMRGPNGAVYDKKSDKIIISETSNMRVIVYDISKDKKTLTQVSAFELYTLCDNLFLDDDGSVYCGCHPNLNEAAVAFSDCDGNTTSSSQVLRIKFEKDYKTAAISEPYANDGKELSGSSVAIVHNDQMLIGSVCKGLLHCEIYDSSVL